MKLSIIIPTLNEEGNLRLLLPFVKRHIGEEDEIIVVDGRSEDQSTKVANDFGVVVVESERGRAKQLNAGAKVARGNVFYFLHADAMPPKSFKTHIADALDKGFQHGAYPFKFNSKSKWLRINSFFTRFNSLMCRGGDQSLFMTKTLFLALNGYCEKHCIMEDYDILIRAKKEAEFVLLPGEISVSARKYENNSYLRVNLSNFVIFKLYSWGVSPQKLEGLYKKMIIHPKA